MPPENANQDEGDTRPLLDNQMEEEPSAVYMFKQSPPEVLDETETSSAIKFAIKAVKLLIYLVTFTLVLASAVASRMSLLFITSQLKIPTTETALNGTRKVCRAGLVPPDGVVLEEDEHYSTGISNDERVKWIWILFFALIVPELFTFIRSSWVCFIQGGRLPMRTALTLVFIIETLHSIGLVLFVFVVLPELDSLRGALLCSCVCLVPSLLASLSHKSSPCLTAFNILALLCQCTGLIFWTDGPGNLAVLPAALILVSFAWWESYADEDAAVFHMLGLTSLKEELKRCRPAVNLLMSLWRATVVFFGMLTVSGTTMGSVGETFDSFWSSFEIPDVPLYRIVYHVDDIGSSQAELLGNSHFLDSSSSLPIFVGVIHVVASYLCYKLSVFACRIQIQSVSMALPLSFAGPLSAALIVVFCGLRHADECLYRGILPGYMFWNCPGRPFFTFLVAERAWAWIFWFLSSAWITSQIWSAPSTKMATEDALFARASYCSALVGESLALDRRQPRPNVEETETRQRLNSFTSRSSKERETSFNGDDEELQEAADGVTRIYACATMWHETREEMKQLLKSLMRMDCDQSARRLSQLHLGIKDKQYYEFEAHILFDDAFKDFQDANGRKGRVINEFVSVLVSIVDEAACNVYGMEGMSLLPPTLLDTPYGGRLEWVMPGHNHLVVHLKDKTKIRHKKRWSQVMYMYYLLGHKLMELDIDPKKKELRKQNTYILALDGDVNFKPEAVLYLVDHMKNNPGLGAACGRIHPVGSGPMVWYQMFEYAVGHWFQKATEHVLGCVLCSPGCFSLFRGEAIMADNVMRTYTTKSERAINYIQYDQGEDRWLCTLLLKQGYQVEYSAASDAYTCCPESFEEFFTQRRRWTPSTMANIIDLLLDTRKTVKNNRGISTLYMAYQGMLMVGTILGPGTIFLMLVGAFVSCFSVSNLFSLTCNAVPVLGFMVVCFLCKQNVQIFVAQVLSAAYALLMMAVVVGIALQIKEDGFGSPSSMFFIATAASFILAAMAHPQEFNCVLHGLLYFVLVPSMYLVLVLYSVINLNVVSWGTRETATVPEADKAGGSKSKTDTLDSATSCSIGNFLTCLWCPKPKRDSMEDLSRKLVQLDLKLEDLHTTGGSNFTKRSVVTRMPSFSEREEELEVYETDTVFSDHNVQEPKVVRNERGGRSDPTHWLSDPSLQRGIQKFLSPKETKFWNSLIDEFLAPEEVGDQSKINQVQENLKALRNRVVSAMLLLNALYVLTILLLQHHKDKLHICWPLGAVYVMSYVKEFDVITIDRDTKYIEPIGLVFVVFFATILLLQLSGMLAHRFHTLSHVLASTPLTDVINKKIDEDPECYLSFVKALQMPQHGDVTYAGPGQSLTVTDIINRGRRQNLKTIDLQSVLDNNLEIHSNIAESESKHGEPLSRTERQTMKREAVAAIMLQRSNSAGTRKSAAAILRRSSSKLANAKEPSDKGSVLSLKRPSVKRRTSDNSRVKYDRTNSAPHSP